MSRYRKVEVQTWGDKKFQALSPLPPSGQGLWLYLLAGPRTSIVPGLLSAGRAAMAEELGWPQEAFDEAFAEAFRLGMVQADWKARLVWLPNALRESNKPESPNVARAWRKEFDLLPECELKAAAGDAIRAFLASLGPTYLAAFAGDHGEAGAPKHPSVKPSPKPSSEASPKASANQEQEQEQKSPPLQVPAGDPGGGGPTSPVTLQAPRLVPRTPGTRAHPLDEDQAAAQAAPDVQQRAALWLEAFADMHLVRRGSRYLTKPQRDFEPAVRLVRAYSPAEMSALTALYLEASGVGFDDKPRTPGHLAHVAPMLEERLKEVGLWPSAA